MPLDTSIYNQIQQPQPVNALANLAQAYQIKGMQTAMDRSDREAESQNRLLQLVQAPEFQSMSARDQAAKLRSGAFFDQAGKVITDDARANKENREAEKAQLEGMLKKFEVSAQIMSGVNDQASWERARALTAQTFGPEAASKMPPQYNPALIQENLAKAMSVKDQVEQRYKALTFEETQRHNQATEANAARGQDLTKRGQDMTDARAREFNDTKVEENRLKREEKKETADMTKASQVASFDTMLGTLDRLSKHPGLTRSVGLMGKLPTMPGGDSANFQAELDTFQSQAFVPMVAQLKGMGALSDAEGRKLTQAVGALNPNMGEKAFRESIGRIMSDMEAARQRVVGKQGAAEAESSVKPAGTTRKVVGGKTYENDGKGWYLVN